MQVLAAANDALRAPREVGGTNDVTVSNRVNLVDPVFNFGSARRDWPRPIRLQNGATSSRKDCDASPCTLHFTCRRWLHVVVGQRN